MKQISKKITALAVVLIIITAASLTASAAENTTTYVYEARTRSCLLVDHSGSIDEHELVNSLAEELTRENDFDFVGYFDDSQISLLPSYEGGGNSHICESIDQVVRLGYTHISVVTDGEQWPKDYTSLGVYSDVDLKIYLIGEKEAASNELLSHLQVRMHNSSLTVVKDGEEEIILDGYEPDTFVVEVPIPEEETLETVKEEHGKDIPWWIWLIVVALFVLPMLWDFIHELLTKHHGKVNPPSSTTVATNTTVPPKPLPVAATLAIAKGAKVLADFSGSFAAQQANETAKVCELVAPEAEVICFGDTVNAVRASQLKTMKSEGCTHGWEAMETAAKKGESDIVIISDLEFNGKKFEECSFPKKFRKATIVVPERYNVATLEQIKEIAEEVEVLPL